jgi:hypothetical protein
MEKGGDGAFTERKKPLDIQCKIESVNVHDGRGEKPKCRLIIKLDYANAADHYAALKRAEDKIRDAKCELYNEEIGVPPHMHREMRLIANTPDQLKEGYLILMKAGKREFHLGYRVNDNDLKLKLPKPGQQVS